MMQKPNRSIQNLSNPSKNPLLIVLSGPSAAGKDAVLSKMKGLGYPLEYIVTLTTRSPRIQEKDNVDYHFVSNEKFQEMVANQELLEWANVYGNWYGVPKQPVEQALSVGRDVIVKIDVQGAAAIKKILPQAVFIFLMPPSMEELFNRLEQRHTESSHDLNLRIKAAVEEMKHLSLFDYAVVNQKDEVESAVSEIRAIIAAEKCRVVPREVTLSGREY